MSIYELISTSFRARAGILKTEHGDINTPVFMPVGTQASVKSLSKEDLLDVNAQVILSNTYHLYLRPTTEVINIFSGLHDFMNWNKPILTDSGGFQIYSLNKLGKVTPEFYSFKSHIDGSSHVFTPEKSVEVQIALNSDIMMCLDQCINSESSYSLIGNALDVTAQWAERCKNFWVNNTNKLNHLFGIIQGGTYKNLRLKSVKQITSIGFPGYAIGGLNVGESKQNMLSIARYTLQLLPGNVPRYIMGVGKPDDIIDLISLGADMFDCVMPTRNARNGQLFTDFGHINIANSKHKFDEKPISLQCKCYTCKNYSKSYLRHLYKSKELLSYRLNTIHNVYYYINLVDQARKAILEGYFEDFKLDFKQKRTNN